MKELKVTCTLYLKVDDDTDIEEALDSLYMNIDTDIPINVHNYEWNED